jgi:hypothetical protein
VVKGEAGRAVGCQTIVADDCSSPLRIAHEHKVSVEGTPVLAARALYYWDVEVVQRSRRVFLRVELCERLRKPGQQLGTGVLQCILGGKGDLGPNYAHCQRVDIAAHYTCSEACGLNQRGATSGERIEYAETGQRTFGGGKGSPEVLRGCVGVEKAGNE